MRIGPLDMAAICCAFWNWAGLNWPGLAMKAAAGSIMAPGNEGSFISGKAFPLWFGAADSFIQVLMTVIGRGDPWDGNCLRSANRA